MVSSVRYWQIGGNHLNQRDFRCDITFGHSCYCKTHGNTNFLVSSTIKLRGKIQINPNLILLRTLLNIQGRLFSTKSQLNQNLHRYRTLKFLLHQQALNIIILHQHRNKHTPRNLRKKTVNPIHRQSILRKKSLSLWLTKIF